MKKILLFVVLSLISAQGADSFKFTEKLIDTIVVSGGIPTTRQTISGTMNGSITMPGLGALQLTANSIWSLQLGDLEIGGFLSDAAITTANSSTFVYVNALHKEIARITFTRNGDRLTIAGTGTDILMSAVVEGLTPGTGAESGVIDLNLRAGPLTLSKPINFKGTKTIAHKVQAGMSFDLRTFSVTGELDVVKPTVSITTPKANARVTETLVSGKATDNYNVDHVEIFVNDVFVAETQLENGLWTTQVNLNPGLNTIGAKSVDSAGNESALATVKVTKVVSAPIMLEVSNGGTVKGATNGQTLEVTKSYTITATADAGYIFTGWKGDRTDSNPALSFNMPQSGITLRATFEPATFTGLFLNVHPQDAGVPPDITTGNSGYFTVTRTATGSASGKILMEGKTYSFSGKTINANGSADFQVPRAGTTSLRVQFTIAFGELEGSYLLDGTVSNGQLFSSFLVADGIAAPSNPWVGKFNAQNYAANDIDENPDVPEGLGFNTIAVTKNNVAFTGMLPDGTAITASAPLAASLQDFTAFPMYVPLQGGKGVYIGWAILQLDSENRTQFDEVDNGWMQWIKAPVASDKRYPDGFSTPAGMYGFRFTPSGPMANQMGWTSGYFQMYGGNIPFYDGSDSINKSITVNKAKVSFGELEGEPASVPSAQALKLNMTLAPGTGLITGDFKHPSGGATTKLNGIVLQSPQGTFATGFFLGQTRSGAFIVSPPENP